MLAGVTLIALVHCLVWFSIYNQTALGESPALDSRQTLELAQAMSEGTLIPEPFHRAPLYPYILSLFLSIGIPFELLPLVARWLNALALATMAVSAALLATRLWESTISGWIAGLLIALNPVLIFFSGDAFDILPASAIMAVALVYLLGWLKAPTCKGSFAIGLLLAVGAALRSHLLPVALLWPVIALILAKDRRILHAAIPAALLAVSVLLLGFANQKVSGEFRLTPWQGAYNLWAGNSPHATGRIYAQSITVSQSHRYDNPAKLESIALYEVETGAAPPHSIDAMNAYWKQKTLDHIASHPVQWLGLMLRKAYYYLNSYEQYDNKTYSFHKARHALLKWNPIHWGAPLILAVAGALVALRTAQNRTSVIVLISIFSIYAAGVILFYTSNRFRLPMLPILAVLAAGSIQIAPAWIRTQRPWRLLLVTCICLTIGITYSGCFNARSTETWEEDYALLANASLRTNRDGPAVRYAESSLAMNPERADMYAVLAQVYFNRWALGTAPQPINAHNAESYMQLAAKGSKRDPMLGAMVGIYEWKLGRHDAAQETWQSLAAEDALALTCLIFTGQSNTFSDRDLKTYSKHPSYTLLLAIADKNKKDKTRLLAEGFLNTLLAPVIPMQRRDDFTDET